MSTHAENTPQKIELVEYDVAIPSADGTTIREKRTIKIPIYRDPITGEEMLTEEAVRLISAIKARYMGLLLPAEIRELRGKMGLTQTHFAEVLCLGAKTPARWETGRERPSQSLNLLLKVIRAKGITAQELARLAEPGPNWATVIDVNFSSDKSPYHFESRSDDLPHYPEAA